MKRLSIICTFLLLASCSINSTRRSVSDGEVSIKGGVSESKSWDDSLVFKRWSWFKDAQMSHDILLAELPANSPFTSWMKNNRSITSRCESFLVGLIYTDNANTDLSLIKSEFEKSGHKSVSLPNFKREIKSHSSYNDWRLGFHKVLGFCAEKGGEIKVTIPGFQTKTLR